MSPAQCYTFMRQAGFTHAEAERFINGGQVPVQNTEMKHLAMQRLSKSQQAATR